MVLRFAQNLEFSRIPTNQNQKTNSFQIKNSNQPVKTIFSLSRGSVKLKNAKKKSMEFARILFSEFEAKVPVRFFEVHVSRFSKNRNNFLNLLNRSKNLKVLKIIDETKLPHNGCRPRKLRRL